MGMLASDVRKDGSLTAAWDGATPATEPSNTCVTVNQPANGCVTFQFTGTFSATVTFEVSLDGTYVAVPATKLGASPAQATTTTTTGIYVVHAPGAVYIRARCSAFSSGTITVIGIGSTSQFIPSAAGLSAAAASTVAGALTNNNAAPSTNHLAALTAVANAAAPSWTEGNEVLLSTNLAGALRVILPGTSVVSGSGTFTVAGALTNNNAAPGATNLGVLAALANASAPSITEGRQSLLSTDLAGALRVILPGTSVVSGTGTFTVAGALTNNNAAPGATNAGVLSAIANASVPSWTEGRQVLASVDLSGRTRVTTETQTVNVAGTTSGGSAFVGPSVAIGFVGTGGTHRNATAVNSVVSTTGNDIIGVGNLVKGTTNYFAQKGDDSGNTIVVGGAATGAAVSGSPVLTGGSDGTNARTFATDTSGRLFLANSAGYMGADGQSSATTIAPVASYPFLFNGTTLDRARNNIDVTHLTSAARTTTQGPTNVTTYNARAIYIVLDMTAVGAGPSVTLKVEMIDPASGKAIVLLTGAAVTTVSTNIYKIGVGLTAAANLVANEYLPRIIAITVTANNANSGTYSVGYSLIAA